MPDKIHERCWLDRVDLSDRPGAEAAPILAQMTDDISLADDADDLAAVDNDNCADAVLVQKIVVNTSSARAATSYLGPPESFHK